MGSEPPPEEQTFIAAVLEEARQEQGISDDEVLAHADTEIIEKSPTNWRWVRAIAYSLGLTSWQMTAWQASSPSVGAP